MPTLFQFLVTLATMAGVIYNATFTLVIVVEPKRAEIFNLHPDLEAKSQKK